MDMTHHYHFDPQLVALSYAISVFGAFTALQLAIAIPTAKGSALWGWVVGAAAAMGGGAIWSMHFIAMLAFRMPMRVSYDLGLTLASLLLAMLVTGAGLFIVGRGEPLPRFDLHVPLLSLPRWFGTETANIPANHTGRPTQRACRGRSSRPASGPRY